MFTHFTIEANFVGGFPFLFLVGWSYVIYTLPILRIFHTFWLKEIQSRLFILYVEATYLVTYPESVYHVKVRYTYKVRYLLQYG